MKVPVAPAPEVGPVGGCEGVSLAAGVGELCGEVDELIVFHLRHPATQVGQVEAKWSVPPTTTIIRSIRGNVRSLEGGSEQSLLANSSDKLLCLHYCNQPNAFVAKHYSCFECL